eukprot:3833695-Pyramimonas_sp.AAC.1
MDQSDTQSAGIFSRRTTQTQEAQVYAAPSGSERWRRGQLRKKLGSAPDHGVRCHALQAGQDGGRARLQKVNAHDGVGVGAERAPVRVVHVSLARPMFDDVH